MSWLNFTIRRKNLFGEATFTRTQVLVPGSDPNFFFRSRHRFNYFIALVITVFALLFHLGFAGIGFGMALVTVALLVYSFVLSKSLAEGLQIRRLCPTRATEGQTLDVIYEIKNPMGFGLESLTLQDRFSGAREDHFNIRFGDPLREYRSCKLTRKIPCDGGMGEHSFGPLTATVSDALGIFQWQLTSEDGTSVQVYPDVTTLPTFEVKATDSGANFGVYELSAIGHSTQFLGIREYQRGDSLRHIAWKLSAKHGDLLVKEYERLSNAYTTFLMDFRAVSHAGQRGDSTWEIMKDILLSFVEQHVERGDVFQIHSQNFSQPFAQGQEAADRLAHSLYRLMPEAEVSLKSSLKKWLDDFPVGSNVVLLQPLTGTDNGQVKEVADLLVSLGLHVTVILIDGVSYVSNRSKAFVEFFSIEGRSIECQNTIDELTRHLQALDVRVYCVTASETLQKAFLDPVGAKATA